MVKKTRLIRGELLKVSSQRLAYKPYNYELSFPGVFVELEIPVSTVVGEAPLVLNLDGLKAILSVTADALDELDEDYKNNIGAK